MKLLRLAAIVAGGWLTLSSCTTVYRGTQNYPPQL